MSTVLLSTTRTEREKNKNTSISGMNKHKKKKKRSEWKRNTWILIMNVLHIYFSSFSFLARSPFVWPEPMDSLMCDFYSAFETISTCGILIDINVCMRLRVFSLELFSYVFISATTKMRISQLWPKQKQLFYLHLKITCAFDCFLAADEVHAKYSFVCQINSMNDGELFVASPTEIL